MQWRTLTRLPSLLAGGQFLLCGTALAVSAPPPSDGSSGSFYAVLGTGDGQNFAELFDTDNGQTYYAYGGGWNPGPLVAFKTIRYNGKKYNAFNFTDITLNPSVPLTIVGGSPSILLASQNISLGGTVTVQADAGGAGVAATPTSPNGGPGGGPTGGGGGTGAGGGTQGAFCSESYTGGGGGGGGNFSTGAPGLNGTYPVDTNNTPIYLAGGPAGTSQPAGKLAGGGGGGAPGGGNANGEFWTALGAAGGGAVLFSTSGTMTITGTINAAGQSNGLPNAGNPGYGAGGAGGDIWLFSTGAFSNSGSILANGGAGGAQIVSLNCADTVTGPGPDGGNGSGGVVLITAPTISNTGTINVSDGGGQTTYGGKVGLNGTVTHRGTIIGRKK
jgi:hypothetical protein